MYDNETNFCCDSVKVFIGLQIHQSIRNSVTSLNQPENVKTLTDNTTYQDWIAQGSEWNEEKSIYMFNFKCPAPGDIGNDIAPNMC